MSSIRSFVNKLFINITVLNYAQITLLLSKRYYIMIIRDSLFVHSVLTADIKLKFTDTQRFERISDFPNQNNIHKLVKNFARIETWVTQD